VHKAGLRRDAQRARMKNTPTSDTSRRNFLLTAAGAAGLIATADLASAQDPRVVLDAAILNYLLRVEYVQAELYREGLSDFTTAARIRQFDVYGGQPTIDTLRSFSDQENQHIEGLRSLVTRLGMTPLPPCTVSFPRFDTAAELVQFSLAIENLGVSAYLGVVPLLRIPQVQTGVASIATVQARHAAYVGLLNGQSPAPAAADTPRSREEILSLLDPYIGRCSATPLQ
jgi:Ferritin-like domain